MSLGVRERENDKKKGGGRSPEVRRPLTVICRKRMRKRGLPAKMDEREGGRGLGGSATCHPCCGPFKYLLEI